MGQDLNLAMDRVLSSRNFANKLWNAGKFILGNLGGGGGGSNGRGSGGSSNGSDGSNGSNGSSSGGSAEWQALAQADFSGVDSLQGLPLTERWILSSLHQVCPESRAYAAQLLGHGPIACNSYHRLSAIMRVQLHRPCSTEPPNSLQHDTKAGPCDSCVM